MGILASPGDAPNQWGEEEETLTKSDAGAGEGASGGFGVMGLGSGLEISLPLRCTKRDKGQASRLGPQEEEKLIIQVVMTLRDTTADKNRLCFQRDFKSRPDPFFLWGTE